jgi:hypothetical protein
MLQIRKVAWIGEYETVRLPSEFRLSADHVQIRRFGPWIVVSPLRGVSVRLAEEPPRPPRDTGVWAGYLRGRPARGDGDTVAQLRELFGQQPANDNDAAPPDSRATRRGLCRLVDLG